VDDPGTETPTLYSHECRPLAYFQWGLQYRDDPSFDSHDHDKFINDIVNFLAADSAKQDRRVNRKCAIGPRPFLRYAKQLPIVSSTPKMVVKADFLINVHRATVRALEPAHPGLLKIIDTPKTCLSHFSRYLQMLFFLLSWGVRLRNRTWRVIGRHQINQTEAVPKPRPCEPTDPSRLSLLCPFVDLLIGAPRTTSVEILKSGPEPFTNDRSRASSTYKRA